LNFLYRAPFTHHAYIGDFLPDIVSICGKLVGDAGKLKRDEPPTCRQEGKHKEYDENDRRDSSQPYPL
jgi:hypothetical protein